MEDVFKGLELRPSEVGVAYDSRAKLGNRPVLLLKIGGSVCVTAVDGEFKNGPLASRLREMSKNHSGYHVFKIDQSSLGPLQFELREAMMAPIAPRSFEEINRATPTEYDMTAHLPEHDLHLNVMTVVDVADKVKFGQKIMQVKDFFDLVMQVGGGFVGKGQASDVVKTEMVSRLPLSMRLDVIQKSWKGAEQALRMYAGTRPGVAGLEHVRAKVKTGYESPAEPMRNPVPQNPMRYAGALWGLAALLRRGARATARDEAPQGQAVAVPAAPPPRSLNAPNRRSDVSWSPRNTEPIDLDVSPVLVSETLMRPTANGARVALPASEGSYSLRVGRRDGQGRFEAGAVFLGDSTVSRDHALLEYNPVNRMLSVTNFSPGGTRVVVPRTPLTVLRDPNSSREIQVPHGVDVVTLRVGGSEVHLDLRTGNTPSPRPAARDDVGRRDARVATVGPRPQPTVPSVAQPAVHEALSNLATTKGLAFDYTSGHKGDVTVRLDRSLGGLVSNVSNRLAVTFLPNTPAPVAKLVVEHFVPAIQQMGARVRIAVTVQDADAFATACSLFSVRGVAVQRAEQGGLIRASLMRGNGGTTVVAGNRADERGLVLDLSKNDLAAAGEHPIEFSVALKLNSNDVRIVRSQLDMVAVRMRTLLRDADAIEPRAIGVKRMEPLRTEYILRTLLEALGGSRQ